MWEFLKNTSTMTRLWGGFLISASMVIIVAIICHVTLSGLLQDAAWVAHTRNILVISGDFDTEIAKIDSAARDYVLTRKPEYRLDVNKHMDNARIKLGDLRLMCADNPGQEERVSQLDLALTNKLAILFRVLAAVDNGGTDKDVVALAQKEGVPASSDRVRELLVEFEASERQFLQARYDKSHKAGIRTITVIWMGCGVAILALLGKAYLLHTEILNNIEATNQCKSNEKYLRMVIEEAYCGFIAIDTGSTILDWNKTAEEIFGYSKKEAIGQSLTVLIIPQEFRPAHTEGILRYEKTNEARIIGHPVQMEAIHKDGHRIPIEMTVNAVHTESFHVFCAFIRKVDKADTLKQAEEGKDVVNTVPADESKSLTVLECKPVETRQ